MKKSAVVVLSGGQDSATCAFLAARQFDIIHCVTFDYAQRHSREIDAAKAIAKIVGATTHEIIHLGPILNGRSPLTDPTASLEQYEDFATMDATIGDRVELTFVPMRNALFLTLAANRAICLDSYDVVTGVCQADNANYPDCRMEFIKAQGKATALALGLTREKSRYTIHAPLMFMTKAQSIDVAVNLDPYGLRAYTALAFTHTAYDGQYPPIGKDHATVLRAHGFEEAGLPDPLVIRAVGEGAMELPKTQNYENADQNAAVLARIVAMKKEFGV